MAAEPPRILIAAPVAVIGELAGALKGAARADGAEIFDELVAKLDASPPDLIIVCYAFDEVRPFRLLHYLRNEYARAHVPTILVRALPVPLGKTEEAQIRESYKTLGVDEFVNLNDEKQRQGREAALRMFRDAVISRLPNTPDSYGSAESAAGPPAP